MGYVIGRLLDKWKQNRVNRDDIILVLIDCLIIIVIAVGVGVRTMKKNKGFFKVDNQYQKQKD